MRLDQELVPLVERNLSAFRRDLLPLWHPLGFVSCVVPLAADLGVVRIHYWPMHERRVKNPNWPIHTHSYRLESLVLRGALFDAQYEAIPGSDFAVYEVSYGVGGSEIVRTTRTLAVKEERRVQRVRSETYVVEKGVFHQTFVPDDATATTLVLLTQQSSEPPLVLGSYQEERYPYVRTPFPKDVFWNEVERAMQL